MDNRKEFKAAKPVQVEDKHKELEKRIAEEKLLPFIDEKYIKRIAPSVPEIRSYRIQGCKQKGLLVDWSVFLGKEDLLIVRVSMSRRNRAIDNEDYLFVLRNFFPVDCDISINTYLIEKGKAVLSSVIEAEMVL